MPGWAIFMGLGLRVLSAEGHIGNPFQSRPLTLNRTNRKLGGMEIGRDVLRPSPGLLSPGVLLDIGAGLRRRVYWEGIRKRCVCTHAYACTYVCMHTRMCACKCVYMQTCICSHSFSVFIKDLEPGQCLFLQRKSVVAFTKDEG